MARSVSGLATFLAVMAPWALSYEMACAKPPPPLVCTGAPTTTGRQLAAAKASPLFTLLQTRFGPPRACQISDSDAGREIRVDFFSLAC